MVAAVAAASTVAPGVGWDVLRPRLMYGVRGPALPSLMLLPLLLLPLLLLPLLLLLLRALW